MTEGILYRATCCKCEDHQLNLEVEQKEVVQHQYIGETSRTLDIRSNQHKNDFLMASSSNITSTKDKKVSSFMWDHTLEKHPYGNLDHTDFKFTVVSSHRDPLSRQVHEAVRIKQATDRLSFTKPDDSNILVKSINRRLEHFAPRERLFRGQSSSGMTLGGSQS